VARKVSLTVNNTPIKLDYFVEGYVYHIANGILASLKDTGVIKKLDMDIDNTGDVKINTMAGMISKLKGVDGALETLELRIDQ
jgi:hypothetical protein